MNESWLLEVCQICKEPLLDWQDTEQGVHVECAFDDGED